VAGSAGAALLREGGRQNMNALFFNRKLF
jgi:hypothetical protein